MNRLDRLETLAQRLIEGTFSRLFQMPLRPADLARHLAVAIEMGRQDDGQTGLISNRYWIMLNPADYAMLVDGSSHSAELANLQHDLSRLIQEADYQLAGPLHISLDQSEAILPGQVEIKVEPASAREQSPLELQEQAKLSPLHAARQWLLQVEARQLGLGEPVISIGRAPDNDIILSDPTVSLHHAQLRWREGRYHLYPPHPPRNGQPARKMASRPKKGAGATTVNDEPVIQQPLAPGDVIRLGQTVITVIVENSLLEG